MATKKKIGPRHISHHASCTPRSPLHDTSTSHSTCAAAQGTAAARGEQQQTAARAHARAPPRHVAMHDTLCIALTQRTQNAAPHQRGLTLGVGLTHYRISPTTLSTRYNTHEPRRRGGCGTGAPLARRCRRSGRRSGRKPAAAEPRHAVDARTGSLRSARTDARARRHCSLRRLALSAER